MTTRIVVIADTHVASMSQLPERLKQIITEAGWVIHCGDYTGISVVTELQDLAPHFIGVYGNTDSPEVKATLPADAVIDVEGVKIAVFHPYWGGPETGLEEELLERFPDVDVILYGHTHDARIVRKNGILLLNPGQGYPTFISQASVGILKIVQGKVEGQYFPLNRAELF